MKIDALYITGERRAEVRTVEIGPPGPGEIQIAVKACGVCAWDAYLFKGMDAKEAFPFRFGHEAVGVVSAMGDGVTRFKRGDAVFCIDCGIPEMAQVVNVPERFAGRIPQAQAYVHEIGEPAVCVVSGIANIDFQPGDDVAIIGTGYMGLLQVQAYRRALIGKLLCFDIDEKKLALAKQYGADECYLSNSPEGAEAARRLAESGGVDITVECSASQQGLQLATDLVKTGGIISNFAWHRAQRTLDASPWHLRGLRIINTSPAADPFFFRHIDKTANLMARGVFDQQALVTHVMDYHDIQEMLTIAQSKADGYIKGVITF